MMSILSDILNFKVGDKIRFIGFSHTIYDKDGNELYAELKIGNTYTVKDVFILSIKIEEFDGMYLTEHFSKIRK